MSDDNELELGTETMIRTLVAAMFKARYAFDSAKADDEADAFIKVLRIAKLEICHFPEGRSEPVDEGAIKIGVGVDNNVLKIMFGKKVAWVGFDKPAAAFFIEKFRFHMSKLK
jgi:hypothetical protein